MPSEYPVHVAVDEQRARLRGQRGGEILPAGHYFQPQRPAHLTAQGQRLVIPLSKGAIKARVVKIPANSGVENVRHHEPIQVIPGGVGIAAALASSNIRVEAGMIRKREANAAAQSLEENLVEEPGTHQQSVEGWKIVKVVVVDVEGDRSEEQTSELQS